MTSERAQRENERCERRSATTESTAATFSGGCVARPPRSLSADVVSDDSTDERHDGESDDSDHHRGTDETSDAPEHRSVVVVEHHDWVIQHDDGDRQSNRKAESEEQRFISFDHDLHPPVRGALSPSAI